MATYVLIANVRSKSDPDISYKVSAREGTRRLSCSCPDFRFAHAPKRCKHLDGVIAAPAVRPYVEQIDGAWFATEQGYALYAAAEVVSGTADTVRSVVVTPRPTARAAAVATLRTGAAMLRGQLADASAITPIRLVTAARRAGAALTIEQARRMVDELTGAAATMPIAVRPDGLTRLITLED